VVKCSGVLQCSDGLSGKVSNIIRRLIDNMKLLLRSILRVLLSQYLLSMHMWLYSCLIMQFIYFYFMIVCLRMTTLTEDFSCFSSVVRQMPGRHPQKRGTARTLPNFCVDPRIFCVVIYIVYFVTFPEILCIYVY
jgi:hypothetical protein